jgi:hypothetical protein
VSSLIPDQSFAARSLKPKKVFRKPTSEKITLKEFSKKPDPSTQIEDVEPLEENFESSVSKSHLLNILQLSNSFYMTRLFKVRKCNRIIKF